MSSSGPDHVKNVSSIYLVYNKISSLVIGSPVQIMWNKISEKVLDAIYRILDSPVIGIIHAVNSTILLALGHFAAQLAILSSNKLPKLEVVFVRSVEQFLMLVPFILLFKSRVLFGSDKWLHLLFISLSGYACYVTLYYVLSLIPLSIALSISATCPFFATIFSYFILKERCEWLDTLCGIVSFIGVLFIARPTIFFGKYGKKEKVFYENKTQSEYESIFLAGCGIALLFGMARALYLVLARKWARESDGKSNQILTVFYPSVLGCLFTPGVMVFTGKTLVIPEHTYGLCSLLSVGILTSLGLMCLTLSLKTQNATVVGVIRNLEIIWSFPLQYMVMNLTPSWWSIGGAGVIISATITASFRDKILGMFGFHQGK